MLVQALQYQNTACERGTAGRHIQSIAPGLWFCVVTKRGWSFLPPTASWRQGSLTQLICLSLQQTRVRYFLDINGNLGNSGNSVTVEAKAFCTSSHPSSLLYIPKNYGPEL